MIIFNNIVYPYFCKGGIVVISFLVVFKNAMKLYHVDFNESLLKLQLELISKVTFPDTVKYLKYLHTGMRMMQRFSEVFRLAKLILVYQTKTRQVIDLSVP